MAAGTVSRDVRESDNDKAFIKVTWVLTTADPAGEQVAIPDFNDKTWTIGNAAGDAFGGATCSLQGVNASGDTLVTLNKAAGGTAATAAAAATINTIENTLFVAPVLTAVGVGATITVVLLARRPNILRN